MVRRLSLGLALWLACSAAGARAQQLSPPPQPTFRLSVDLITSDVIVRDRRGQFVTDLAKDDFEIYEDDVRQDLTWLVLVHGGRAFTTVMAAAATPAREGIIMAAPRPASDVAGRVILFVVDDLHLEFRDTSRIRALFNKVAKELVHEGDLFGIVSTGPSSIAIDLTYDRTRLDEAAKKITGGGLRPSEIVEQRAGPNGSGEVRFRAHVAFSVAFDLIDKLSLVLNRRKAVVVISNGYDFNPFEQSQPRGPSPQGNSTFADAELAGELHELTRAANRANATFYTIDPRGLIAGQDIDKPVNSAEWESHLQKSQDSLRVMAEQTGGIAIVNTNDFDRALRRIDAESSDYYVLGYYSKNLDPEQRRRSIEIRATRKGPDGTDLNVMYRREYTIKPPPKAAPPVR